MGEVLELRAALWSAGYRPVAVKSGQKAPDGMDWVNRARLTVPDAATRFEKPNALSTGILCDGLRAVDIDIDDMKTADQVAAIVKLRLGSAPIRTRSGTGKRLIVYKAAEGQPKKRFIKGENKCAVEILGYGQQFVAFGVHPEGMAYEWDIAPNEWPIDQLTAVSEDQITDLLDFLATIIGGETESERDAAKAGPVVSVPSVVPASSERMGKYAQSVLDKLVSELAAMRSDDFQNDFLNSAAVRCGGMAARGWIGESECRAALLGACQSNGLAKEQGHHAINATFKSGWGKGLTSPARDVDDRPAEADGWNVVIDLSVERQNRKKLAQMQDDDDDSDEAEEHLAALIDEGLTYPSGVLGELTDWIVNSGSTKNRLLALGAALSLTSTLLGRTAATPTKGSLELFVVSLFPSGAGKSHQKNCINKIMKRLGLVEDHLAGKVKSGAAFEDIVRSKPLCLFLWDEFGEFLAKITDGGSGSSHLKEIPEYIKEFWGINFGDYISSHALTRRAGSIQSPAVSIYAMSTADAFFRSTKSKDIANGLLNRFTVIDAGQDGDETLPTAPDEPPQGLIDRLARLYRFGMPQVGNMAQGINKNMAVSPAPLVVPWHDDKAKALYEAFRDEFKKRRRAEPEMGEMLSRASFMALKMATILACSSDHIAPRVTAPMMQWGIDISRQGSDRFLSEIKRNMVDPLSYPELFRKIEDILRQAKEPGLPARAMRRQKLWDKTRNYCGRSASDFSNCIKELQNNNIVESLTIGKRHIIVLARRGARVGA